MRIAFVTETWYPSVDGVVTRLEATISELQAQGHQVLVVAPGPGPLTSTWPPRGGGEHDGSHRGSYSRGWHRFLGYGFPSSLTAGQGTFDHDQTLVVGLPTVSLPFLAGGKPWGLPLPRVRRELARFAPDVIHVLNPFVAGIAGIRAARALNRPLVASFHQDIAAVSPYYGVGWLGAPIWAFVRCLHNAATANLATSATVVSRLEAHGIDRVSLWPFGVDLDLFHPSRHSESVRRELGAGPGSEILALYVGRLAPEKEIARLAALTAGGSGIRLVVVGDGYLRPALEARFGPSVTFAGYVGGEHLAEIYASADVFVFPSRTETLGLVLLEALASGLPVVACDSATTREVRSSGAPVGLYGSDDLGALPELVVRLASDRTRREDSRRAAETYSWNASTAALVSVYEGVIETQSSQVQSTAFHRSSKARSHSR